MHRQAVSDLATVVGLLLGSVFILSVCDTARGRERAVVENRQPSVQGYKKLENSVLRVQITTPEKFTWSGSCANQNCIKRKVK